MITLETRTSAMKMKMVSNSFKEFHLAKKSKADGRWNASQVLDWIGSMFDQPARYVDVHLYK